MVSPIESIRELVYNTEAVAAIPQKDRKYLMAALERLKPTTAQSDLTLARGIIGDYAKGEPLKKSRLQRISNSWKGIFPGRITQKKRTKQLHETGKELFLREGLALLSRDRPRAIGLLAAAYKVGSPQAAYHIGKLLEGELIAEEWQEIPHRQQFESKQSRLKNAKPPAKPLSLFFYKEAAKGGVKEAQYELGLHYESLIPNKFPRKASSTWNIHALTKKEQEAVNWYKKAARQGHEEAMYRHGRIYARIPNLAFTRELVDVAEAGHPKAQLMVGLQNMTYTQSDVAVDPRFTREAMRYLQKVTENPNASRADKADAYFLKGMIELVHNKNGETGLESMRRAAELGCIEAQIVTARHASDQENKNYWIAHLRAYSPLDVHPERFGFERYQSGLSKTIYVGILGEMLHDLGLISVNKKHELLSYGNRDGLIGYPALPKIALRQEAHSL